MNIRWQVPSRTDSDVRLAYFTLERARNAQAYETLTLIQATTVPYGPVEYEFEDETAPQNTLPG